MKPFLWEVRNQKLTWLRFSGGNDGSPSWNIKRINTTRINFIINIISLHTLISTRKPYEYWQINITHNEFPVLLLEALVALPQLVGHQLVLVSLLLTRIQLFGQNEQGLLLTLQFALTHQELIPHTHKHNREHRRHHRQIHRDQYS